MRLLKIVALQKQVSIILIAGLVALCLPHQLFAGTVQLKNGMRIEGKPVKIQDLTRRLQKMHKGPTVVYSFLNIDTGMKRYFVSARQVQEIDPSVAFSKYDRFNIPQKRTGRKITISSLGPFAKLTEFDKYGRRTVSVRTKRGLIPIVQGISIIDPRYLTITGITHVWEHGLATTSVPPANLDLIIRNVTDQENPDDRMSIARFYFQAGMYIQAEKELKSIMKDFPTLKAQIEKIDFDLRDQQAKELIRELERRRKAGQHRLAYNYARLFPKERLSAGVLRQVNDLKNNITKDRNTIEQVKTLLGEFQSQLKDDNLKQAVMPLRSEVSAGLNLESLKRLKSFINLSTDDKLEPGEKLALAYSGWVLGSNKAVTDLGKAIHLWQARFLMTDYLHTHIPQQRNEILTQLNKLEGVSPQTVIDLIPLLPPQTETPNLQAGVATEITIPKTATREEMKYHVLLPQEYSPYHSYPMIVALRPIERRCQNELVWWGGTKTIPLQSQRRGYIVIAPEYLKEKQAKYEYSAIEHTKVLAAIHDAKQRFIVDSDRVFLSGHGIGGDAAADIGMSHPGLFAGVIPICGLLQYYTNFYRANVKHVPWYFVGGELDRNTLDQNAKQISWMMRHGYDVIYCEYIGRGYESYYAEIHKLFDWMDTHKRPKDSDKVTAVSLRPGDNHFYWIEVEGFPIKTLQSDVVGPQRKGRIVPLKLEARVSKGNTIYLQSGAKINTIWINKSLVDFDKKLQVRFRGKNKFKDFPEADIATILEDYERRADRQKIYSMKVIVN